MANASTPKKGRPTQGKKARAEARRKAARQRQVQNIGLGVAVAVVVALVAILVTRPNPDNQGIVEIQAWDLPAMGRTADIQDRVTLAEFDGRPTVVNFFASWCVECDRELPGFLTVSRELEGQVNFVGIASQETGNPLLMAERHGVDWWPLARDVGGRVNSGLSEALGAVGMPLTAFYDADGNFLTVQLGALTEPQLRARINELYGLDI